MRERERIREVRIEKCRLGDSGGDEESCSVCFGGYYWEFKKSKRAFYSLLIDCFI